MLDVLKARWQTRGWHPMVKEDSEPMALEFIRELDRHDIPWQHYRELYNRSVDLRANRMAQGLSCDDFSADVMIACWPSLRSELKQREIDTGRILTGNAETQCPDCFGTGMKLERDPVTGSVIGSGGHCNHEHSGEEPEVVTMPFEPPSVPQPSLQTSVQICSRIRQELARIHILAEDAETATAAWDASRTWAHAEAYCRRVDA